MFFTQSEGLEHCHLSLLIERSIPVLEEKIKMIL